MITHLLLSLAFALAPEQKLQVVELHHIWTETTEKILALKTDEPMDAKVTSDILLQIKHSRTLLDRPFLAGETEALKKSLTNFATHIVPGQKLDQRTKDEAVHILDLTNALVKKTGSAAELEPAHD